MVDLVNMYGDATISHSGDDGVLGLDIDEFHTYRFESLDGVHYWISVDGLVFIAGAKNQPNGYHTLQFGGDGGCLDDQIPNMVNEWDFVRFGTISYGERIIASDPPGRFLDARRHADLGVAEDVTTTRFTFLDAREHADLDRFTVTFDSPNYVYLDEIMVIVTDGVAPTVTQTRRRDNDEPETVEIVLDAPLPMGETTYFIFDDGLAANVVAYTFAPGDTDGDGDADLRDAAAFQNCFGHTDPTEECQALDLNEDSVIDLADYAEFLGLLAAPRS